jgi:hypothetical protein
MKNLLISLLVLFCLSDTYAQIGIKANNTAPISSAQLEVQSTTKAFYPPRMATAQKNAIVSPQAGAVVYDTNLGVLNYYNGSAWLAASGGSGLTLPYSQTGNDVNSDGLFKITDNSANVNGRAISGISNSGFGVIGNSTSGVGVQGNSTSFSGVAGSSANGIGVRGFSDSNYGVNGSSISGDGGVFSSSSGRALRTFGAIRFGGSGVGTLGTGKFLKSINSFGDAEWSDLLPLSVNQSSVATLLQVVNMGTGYAIFGGKNGSGGAAIFGNSDLSSGVLATTSSGVGIEANAFSTGIAASFTSNGGYSLITNGGKVGFGTQNPSLNADEMVDINGRLRIRNTGSSTANTAGVWFNNSTNSIAGNDGAFSGMKADTEVGLFIGGAWRFWVANTGNATLTGTLTQSSDRRLKKDFSLLNNSLSDIYQLKGYHYKWIEASRSQDLQTGLIAQEVQKIFPELVQTDEKGFLSVNYIGLIPHLIEGMKALKDENASLKSRLDKIEAMLTNSQLSANNVVNK